MICVDGSFSAVSVSKDPQKVVKYPHYSSVLKLKAIQFPMTLKQIPPFEKQNNIFNKFYVLKKKRKIQLLIQNCHDEFAEHIRFHNVWIKDFSRLFLRQLSTHNRKTYWW